MTDVTDIYVDNTEPLIIGATGMDAIRQNIRIIYTTMAWSVPLDRAFAHVGTAIDSPAPAVTARLVAEITDAIEKYEPRVKVTKIDWENNAAEVMAGTLRPHIFFSLRQGVEL